MARQLDVRPKTYDEAKLAAMVPPFNVRIEKIKGSTRMPIPLPESDDATPPGTGWDIDTVRQLESWLVTDWAGGGLYEVNLTDSSPTPQTMKWQPFWDPKIFPEKTPPPLVDAAVASAQPQPQQHQQPPLIGVPQYPQPQAGRMSFPNGLPQSAYPQQASWGHQQQPYYQQAPMPNAPMPGTFQWEAYKAEVERREQVNKDRALETQLANEREARVKMEREALNAKHAAEIERERQANEARFQAQANQMTELRAMITGLTSAIKDTASASKVSPELEAMREQQRATTAQLDRERAERESERREATLKETIKGMQEQTQRQIDLLTRQLDDRTRQMEMAAQNNSKPDQLLMMWQNSQREQIEATKELARNHLAQMTSMQSFMMNPRDMMTLAKESSQGIDQATDRVSGMFSRIIETQQKVTENLLSMQPSSNGIVDLVGNGMDRIGSLAERYIGGKQLETQLAHQSQVQVAEAQARAYAETQIAAAQAHVAAQQQAAQAAQPPAPPPTQGAGLGNPVPPKPSANGANGAAKPKKAKAAAPATPVDATRRLGKTDAEWFGPILPQVQELRTNAHKFIESLKSDPPKLDKQGNPFGWGPEHAAMVIIQATGIVVQRQIQIPIMMELLFQDRFADFVDVLVPDPIVTQPYRDDLVQNMIRAARVASGLPPEGEQADHSQGEADDDDDDDADDNADGIDAADGADDTDDDLVHEDLLGDQQDEATDDAEHDGRAMPAPIPINAAAAKKPATAPVARRT